MSVFTEAVLRELSPEWRSTREIADSVPVRGVSDNSHMSNVGRTLRKAVRDGLAEGRAHRDPRGYVWKEWRLRA